MLSNEPLNDRISATSVTISNTIRRRPDSHGPQHRRLRGLSNNRTVMQARRTVRETTGSSVGWSAIVVVFSATARSMPAHLMSMSMSMPVAGDGVAGGRSGVVVRPAGTGGRAPTAVYGSTWVQCPAALVAREVLAGVADVTAEHGAIKVVGFQHLRPARGGRDARFQRGESDRPARSPRTRVPATGKPRRNGWTRSADQQ